MLEKYLLKQKRKSLSKLNRKSIDSISTVQAAMDELVNINSDIDRTANDIENIKANFALIEKELKNRKESNSTLINQIKKAMK